MRRTRTPTEALAPLALRKDARAHADVRLVLSRSFLTERIQDIGLVRHDDRIGRWKR